MGKTDKLLFLVSILFFFLLVSGRRGSAEVQEQPIETPMPDLTLWGVDLNSADAETLCTIPGIGPFVAEQIIEKREALGGFACFEDLRTVPGIGDKMMEKIYAG